MKKTDQLSIAHAAYLLGAATPGKVEKATGMAYTSAAQCLYWIRQASGDLRQARQLRNEYSAEKKRLRYSVDPVYRALVLARNTAWQYRQTFCRNGYRVRPGTSGAVM